MSSQVKNNIDFMRPSYNIQVYKNNYLDDNNLMLSPSKDNMTTSPSLLTSTELFVAKPKQSELRSQIENELNPMLFSFKNEIKIMISDFKKELGDYALLKEKIEVIEKHYEQSQTRFSEKIDKLLYENTKEFNDYKEENKQKINNLYDRFLQYEKEQRLIIKRYGELSQEEIKRINKIVVGEIKDNLYNITSRYSKFLKEKFPDIWNECLSENK